CIKFLKFDTSQLHELTILLNILDRFHYCHYGCEVTTLAATLYRLSYLSRLKQSFTIFRYEHGWLSTIFNDVCSHLHHHYADKLYWDTNFLSSQYLEKYYIVTANKGELIRLIWEFIDEI
ncbi:hypothetical protein L873DRAFT_1773938, partial [Choiromyces venosus 120613-1]